MKTALVLGGGGFIGSHMVTQLKNEGYSLKQIQPIISSYKLEEIQVKILNTQDTKFELLNETIEKIDEISLSKKLVKLGRDEGRRFSVLPS